MYNSFYKPQILEYPACGAMLALPETDIFEWDGCGKFIIVPPEYRLPQPAYEADILMGDKIKSEIGASTDIPAMRMDFSLVINHPDHIHISSVQ